MIDCISVETCSDILKQLLKCININIDALLLETEIIGLLLLNYVEQLCWSFQKGCKTQMFW